MNVDVAILVAARAHLNQNDKVGQPYILHSLRVMQAVTPLGEDAMVVAVLHDVIEDTYWTMEMLQGMPLDAGNLTPEQARALDAVTQRKGEETYREYIERVRAAGSIAIHVKIADIEDNLSPKRMDGLEPGEARGLAKRYRRALERLAEVELP